MTPIAPEFITDLEPILQNRTLCGFRLLARGEPTKFSKARMGHVLLR